MTMDPNTIEAAERACLKQAFGGTLHPDETKLLDAFLTSEEGRSYLAQSERMKHTLGEVADVRVTEPVDGGAMATAFETMARDELHASRRQMPLVLIGSTAMWWGVGAACLLSGKPDLEFFAWSTLVLGVLNAVFFILLHRMHAAMLTDQDLLKALEDDRALGSSPKVVAIAALIALTILSVLGYGIGRAGGALGVTIFLTTTTLAVCVAILLQQRERRRNQALWDWWDGEDSGRG